MNGLHPIFVPGFGPLMLPQTDDELRMSSYWRSLQRMNWAYRWSDDAHIALKGRDELKRLEHERSLIDAQGTVWNSLAPASHRFCPLLTRAADKASERRFTGAPQTGFGEFDDDKVREEFRAGLDSVDDKPDEYKDLQSDQLRDMNARSQ